jgi:metal-responsive CopG/Arc/MetJ family transcriptional regulator
MKAKDAGPKKAEGKMDTYVETKALHMVFDGDLVQEVDEYCWRERLPSRKDAMQQLVKMGLEAAKAKLKKGR